MFFVIFVVRLIIQMDITAFVRELLFSHDCVIVPGFGGFIGNYTPARIDKSTSTFYPPVKQISFNRNLNHNDGLLAGRVSSHAKVSYGDARNIVEEFVTGLRRKLEKGEKVVFDNIGSFINNQEGNVQFEPDRSVNYHLDSYGLESFRFAPLEGYDVRKRISKHIDRDPVKRASARKILWRAAVIIPLLALMVAVPLKTRLFKSKIETFSLNPLAKAEFEENKEAVDKGIPEVIIKAEEPSGQQPVPETKAPSVESNVSYCIITGSFKIRHNAETQAGMLAKEGYTPEIIEGPNGFYRVSAMKCAGLNAAEGKRDSISEKFPGSWIKKIN
jgi:nucleoid DNA-binding protein